MRCARIGVDKPVIPGIMPVLTIVGIKRMAEMQGSEFPEWLAEKLVRGRGRPRRGAQVGIEEATKLCRALLDGGAPGLHFYTLNRSTATREIHANLGSLTPRSAPQARLSASAVHAARAGASE